MSKKNVTTKGPAPKRAGAKSIIAELLELLAEFTGERVNYSETDPKREVNARAIKAAKVARDFIARKPAKRHAAKKAAKPAAGKIKRHVYTASPGQVVKFEDRAGNVAFSVVIDPENALHVSGHTGGDGEGRETVLVMPMSATAICVTRPGDWKTP